MSKVQKLVTEQDLQEVGHSRRVVKKEFLDQLIVRIKGRDISKQEEQWTKALEKETIVMCPSKVICEMFVSTSWEYAVPGSIYTCSSHGGFFGLTSPPPPTPTPPTVPVEIPVLVPKGVLRPPSPLEFLITLSYHTYVSN